MRKEGPLEKETIKSVVIKPNMGKYDDIINLEHHVSKNHKQMSLYDRSAQFAPFAALVGYDESINEAGRETNINPVNIRKVLIGERKFAGNYSWKRGDEKCLQKDN